MLIENQISHLWQTKFVFIFKSHFAYRKLPNDENKFLKRLIHAFA